MGAVLISLIDQWLAGCDAIEIRDDASTALARELARDRGAAIGLDETTRENLVAAVSELARNQLRHATGGAVGAREVMRGDVAGLELVAADRGPGIADPTAAFAGATRIAGSLGVGVGAAYRLAHELDLDVRWGEGTCVAIRSFTAPVPRSEVAVLGRPCRGEDVSGDHALIRRGPRDVLIAVVDGLGHGVLAREPADRAIATLAGTDLDRPLDELAVATDAALAGTRGVVMTAVRMTVPAAGLDHAGVGNVSMRIVGADGKQHMLAPAAGVLGGSSRPKRPVVVHAPVAAGEVVVVATDGLTSRVDLARDVALLRRPPIVLAHHLVTAFGRPDDDVTVVVAR